MTKKKASNAPQLPRTGVVSTILGSLGDALVAMAVVKAGVRPRYEFVTPYTHHPKGGRISGGSFDE